MTCDETRCERCGGHNPDWHGPEFVHLVGSRTGIFCPTCFTSFDQNAVWLVTRLAQNTEEQVRRLADVLRGCLGDPSDAERLAGCVLHSGWRGPDDLARMKTALNEACDIAERVIADGWPTPNTDSMRIAELRKVGAK